MNSLIDPIATRKILNNVCRCAQKIDITAVRGRIEFGVLQSRPSRCNVDRSADIHLLVEATAYELGMPSPVTVSESLLVRDGCFIGHKFRFDGGYAIWGEGGIQSSSTTTAGNC